MVRMVVTNEPGGRKKVEKRTKNGEGEAPQNTLGGTGAVRLERPQAGGLP